MPTIGEDAARAAHARVADAAKVQITTFKALRSGKIERVSATKVLKRKDYLTILRLSEGYGQKPESEIITFARDLHEYLRDQMELSEAYKPLIVSAILLGLKDNAFERSYRDIAEKDDLADALIEAIRRSLKKARVKNSKFDAILSNYGFIQTNKSVKEYLREIITKIYRNLFFALLPNSSFDLLGSFYGEFLRYSGGDQQGLGIVLTPRHITELFSDLADLNPNESVVLDICAGTGGFLIAAMAAMAAKAQGDSATIERIRERALVGIELDPHMFTLACANMIFRGDGKANMFWDDCLSPRDSETIKRLEELKPNLALLNSPFSKKTKGIDELSFAKRALDYLQPNGKAIVILPVGALTGDSPAITVAKKELLDSHTLLAAMSLPPTLFPGVGTVAGVAVFEAHRPHYRNGAPRTETWFGYWRDDGFIPQKNKRVERRKGIWQEIRAKWLDAFFNQRVVPGESCKVAVRHDAEWCAEPYLETDYSTPTEDYFDDALRDYSAYKRGIKISSGKSSWSIDPSSWKSFALGDLFDIKKGTRLIKSEMKPGPTPFVSAIDSNNGVRQRVSGAAVHPAGLITVVYNGNGVADAFYQPEPFMASDDVNVLYPKNPMDESVALFNAG